LMSRRRKFPGGGIAPEYNEKTRKPTRLFSAGLTHAVAAFFVSWRSGVAVIPATTPAPNRRPD
jgi:hypothetical protein